MKPVEGDKKGLIHKILVTELSQSIDETDARQWGGRSGYRSGLHRMAINYVSHHRKHLHGLLKLTLQTQLTESKKIPSRTYISLADTGGEVVNIHHMEFVSGRKTIIFIGCEAACSSTFILESYTTAS